MIVRVHIRVFDRRGQRRKDDKFMEYYHSEIRPIEIVKTEKLNITFQRHNHVEHYVISIVEAGHV